MKFEYLEKKEQGHFITRYDIHYRTSDDQEKVYEMISRNPDLKTLEDLHNPKEDAVAMILHDRTGEKILLNREFRMATGRFVYNFPAGLIDEGETPEEAAKRELKEETGLDLIEVKRWWGTCYSAIGFSNERNACCEGIADGTFSESTSTQEEISAGWYTKEEVRKLLETEPFAVRTQAYCYCWTNS
ncbi:MAG: NUDIX hydrolase [Butyrivibrio sp.]|nr:NUDIX hydrolase [Butyrivibrio sp.]